MTLRTPSDERSVRARRPIVAFDLDNTLVDPDGAEYRRTVSAFLSRHELGLTEGDRCAAYERVRRAGDALEACGLGNALHDRGHPDALAALVLCFGRDPALQRRFHLTDGVQAACRETFGALVERQERCRTAGLEPIPQTGDRSAAQAKACGSARYWDSLLPRRLTGALAFFRFVARDAGVVRLREQIGRIASDSLVIEWASTYGDGSAPQANASVRQLIDAASVAGATPVVISEGRSTVQMEKLSRAGLAACFEGRVLISEAAANVPGRTALTSRLALLIESTPGGRDDVIGPELEEALYVHCVLNEWSRKTPSFFARCLHAIARDSVRPQDVLARPVFVSSDEWRERPIRFVMIGDRFDKDVEPLIELLGPGVGLTVRLRAGKYGHLHHEDALPQRRRPDHTFTDVEGIAAFLTNELSFDAVRPIATTPELIPPPMLRADLIRRGLESDLEAVRAVAGALAPMCP